MYTFGFRYWLCRKQRDFFFFFFLSCFFCMCAGWAWICHLQCCGALFFQMWAVNISIESFLNIFEHLFFTNVFFFVLQKFQIQTKHTHKIFCDAVNHKYFVLIPKFAFNRSSPTMPSLTYISMFSVVIITF